MMAQRQNTITSAKSVTKNHTKPAQSRSQTGATDKTFEHDGWWALLCSDLHRYRVLRPTASLFTLFATEQALWAIVQYRVSSAVYRSNLSWPVKRSLLYLAVLWQKFIEIVTGISLPYSAHIGPGLYVGHYGHTMVHAEAVIGRDCNLAQGVQIGEAGRGSRRGVPVIGDRVYFGINAIVVGQITVGNDALIGACSLVNRDVPPHTTVIGVPAQVINNHGSAGYVVLD